MLFRLEHRDDSLKSKKGKRVGMWKLFWLTDTTVVRSYEIIIHPNLKTGTYELEFLYVKLVAYAMTNSF